MDHWKKQHDAIEQDCWVWEDLIAKANFQFGRLLDLDADFQEAILLGRIAFDADREAKIDGLFAGWLKIGEELKAQVDRLRAAYDSVDGSEALESNVKEAKAILTPDDEFFDPDVLGRMADAALEAHRAGLTEVWLPDELDPA